MRVSFFRSASSGAAWKREGTVTKCTDEMRNLALQSGDMKFSQSHMLYLPKSSNFLQRKEQKIGSIPKYGS